MNKKTATFNMRMEPEKKQRMDEFFTEGKDYLNLSHITDDNSVLEKIAGHGFKTAEKLFSRDSFAEKMVEMI